jgi:hypothetical protein
VGIAPTPRKVVSANELPACLSPSTAAALTLRATLPAPIRARYAVPSAVGLNASVLGVERVSLDALRLAGLAPGGSVAAQEVLASSDRLQMSWIDASAHTAQMVYVESFGNWPNEHFVRKPMSAVRAWLGSSNNTDLQQAVSASPQRCRPQPTRAEVGPAGRYRAVLIDLGPEASRLGEARSTRADMARLRLHRGYPFGASPRPSQAVRGHFGASHSTSSCSPNGPCWESSRSS